MASVEFKNNAQSTVADNPLTAGATTLNIATGEGAKFPAAFPFKITLWDASMYPNPGNDPGMEIVKCTARTTDALTIVRAQEGTSGVEHTLGERVAMLITAGHFNDAVTGIITKLDTVETNAKDDQIASEVPNTPAGNIVATNVQAAITELDTEKVAKSGDIMTGDLDQGGNYLINSLSVNALNAKGAGYWLDGVNDYIDCGNGSNIDIIGDISIIQLLNLPTLGITQGIISTGNSASGSDVEYGIWVISSAIKFVQGDGIDADLISMTPSPPTGENILICAVRSGTSLQWYLNGITRGSGSLTTTPTTITKLIIGALKDSSTHYTFKDSIYQTLIFNRALSATEAKAFSSGAPIDFADIGADNLEVTSGTLVVGKRYRIKDWITNDDFTNVGGTNADGDEFVATGTTPTTWTNSSILLRIGCVLQLEQDGIGHNQWLDKSGNENHGAVSGAIPTNLECNHIERYEQVVAMTDDTAWTNIVPAGYELEKIIFNESAGNAATLDLGKTSGASDVFSQEVIAASTPTTVVINKTFSMSAAQSLYLNDDGAGTWNSASVTATLFMRRVKL